MNEQSGPMVRQWSPTAYLSCDQVAWVLAAIRRYIPPQDTFPHIGQQHEMQVYSMLYELMDIANLGFADTDAANNGTPHFLLKLRGFQQEGGAA